MKFSVNKKEMKMCELCNILANMYCESDEAMLCWDCDSRVHGANFLVAKHLRTLLCHLCQSPTSWNGSGPKLGPIVSACSDCIDRSACREETNNSEEDDEDDVDIEAEDDGGGDAENQVVPWSSMPSISSSSSTSGECSNSQSTIDLSLKRMRESTVEPGSRDHLGCSFSAQQQSMNLSNESAFGSLKAQKIIVRDRLFLWVIESPENNSERQTLLKDYNTVWLLETYKVSPQ